MLGPGFQDNAGPTAIVLCQKGGIVISADLPYMSLVTLQAMGRILKSLFLWKLYIPMIWMPWKAIDGDTKLLYVCKSQQS